MNGLLKKCLLLFTLVLNAVAHVFISPLAELVENRHQGFSCFRKRIFYFRRDLHVNFSGNKTVFLKLAKLFCKHGAIPDSWFVHLSIAPNTRKGDAEWLEPVTDEEYNNLKL
jgi:hypothetical protein